MKPVMAHLRLCGYTCAIYIDDTFLQGSSINECRENVLATRALLQELGFIINTDKSVMIPSRVLIMLGFIINSQTMTVILTEHKADNIRVLC
jgi:hypothetical protein